MSRPGSIAFFPKLAVLIALSLLGGPVGDSSAGAYRDSAHGGLNGSGPGVVRTGTILQGPYAAGNCAHCHEQHASINGSEPAPVKGPTGPSRYLLLDDLAGNAACNYCHDISAKNGADNIASQIAKNYKHDPNSGFLTAQVPTLWCIDCHDSHVAQKTNHVEATGGNLVNTNSPIYSVPGTSVTNWTAGILTPPGPFEALGTATLGTATPTIAYEYQLCFNCHAGQLGAGAGARFDVHAQFNPTNASVHPVATEGNPTWKNNFLRGAGLNATWGGNVDAEMYCSDCHGSETGTDPKGPHGSTIPYLLKAGNTPAGDYDLLCLRCHLDPGVPGNSAWLDLPAWNWWPPVNPQTAGQIAPQGPHALAQHRSPTMGGTNPLGCVACHGGSPGAGLLASNIHGANYLWPMFGGMNGRGSTEFLLPSGVAATTITQNYYNNLAAPFTNTPGNRRCASGNNVICHAADGGIGYLY